MRLNEPEHVAYLNMFEHNKSIKKKPKLRNAPLKIVCQASNGTLWLKRLAVEVPYFYSV